MKTIPWLMISCRTAAGLIDKKSANSLSLVERWKLSYHKGMCELCIAYEKKSGIIDKVAEKVLSQRSGAKTLPESVKSKIIESLKEK